MGDVYVNGMEVCGKYGGGKMIAAMPDVCLSPPSPPAGPVPLPYPNFAVDSDTDQGSTTVLVGRKEVMLKDKSCFKKCTGDEAATKSLGQGTLTHVIQGKVYFISWSMDVEFEGENAVRHLDSTTSNHASPMANRSAPNKAVKKKKKKKIDCKKVLKKYPVQSYSDQAGDLPKNFQSHHVIQNSHFQYPRGTTVTEICAGYTEGDAPCIGLLGDTDPKTPHGKVSKMQKADAKSYRKRVREGGANPTYKEARADAKKQLMAKNPGPGLTAGEAECVLKAVDKKFREMCKKKSMSDTQLRAPGQRGKGFVAKVVKKARKPR